jgi:hypothetical protein
MKQINIVVWERNLTVKRRCCKWYNITVIKLGRRWFFLELSPVKICSIWAVEVQEVSLKKWKRKKCLVDRDPEVKKKTLYRWGKQKHAHCGSVPPTVSLYILQCFPLTDRPEIWNLSSTVRPRQCSWALKRTLIPFNWSTELQSDEAENMCLVITKSAHTTLIDDHGFH